MSAIKRSKPPSPAGRRVLLNILAGRDSAFGLSGRSAFGGLFRTMLALRNAGLVTKSPDECLTPLGREVAAQLSSVKPQKATQE